jgi:outer membrane protein, heavy metal efflux system
MPRAIIIFLCLFALATFTVQAQERLTSLTLDEALALATRENFTLRAAQFEYQATRANEVTAGLIPNPSFSYLGEQLNEPANPSPGQGTGQQYTVTIGQTFETGGKRQRRLDSARATTLVAGHALTGVEQQVLFQVKKSFTDVLTAKAALELAEQNLKTIGEIEKIQSLRADKGALSELELLRIQVQQYTFLRDAADARQAVQAAKNALRTFAGPDRIADEYDVVGKLDFRNFTFNKPDLYSLARANRPDILAAEAARQKARADIDLAKANAWWDLTPLLEYRRDGKIDTVGVGISFPIRVFDRNQGEILRTSSEARSIEATYQGTVAQALSEIDTAFGAMLTEREKVTTLRDNYLPKAQKARDIVEFAYGRGGVSLLDFLDAERTFRETSLEYLRSLGNYWTAVYQLELAVGSPLVK